jgi:CBS domain-containing protein
LEDIMRNTIGQLCNRAVVTIGVNATVAEAATLMREHHIGALVVAEEKSGGPAPIGMLTDRDIVVEVVAGGLAPQTLKVGEIVQRAVFSVSEDEGSEEAIRLMAIKGVRRMAVVDSDGRLVGIVTLDDVLRHVIGSLTALGDLAERERRFEAHTRR